MLAIGLASEQPPSSRPSSRPRIPGSSASSLRLTPSSQPHSSRPSFEEERPEFLVGSSRSPLPPSPSTQRSLSRSHHREGSSDLREHAEDARGRKHKRFTLANVSNALLDVVMDRVRSRSRSSFADGLPGDATPPRGRTRERTIDEDVIDNDDEGTAVRERERSTLGRVSEVLGLDGEDGKEWGDGWKEFKKGEDLVLSRYASRSPAQGLIPGLSRSPSLRARRRRCTATSGTSHGC